MEESESYLAFTEAERKEFIFHIFMRLAIGGGMCQYEDLIEPYLNATKLFYKDLVSVTKDSETKQLSINTCVLEIRDIDGCNLYKTKLHP